MLWVPQNVLGKASVARYRTAAYGWDVAQMSEGPQCVLVSTSAASAMSCCSYNLHVRRSSAGGRGFCCMTYVHWSKLLQGKGQVFMQAPLFSGDRSISGHSLVNIVVSLSLLSLPNRGFKGNAIGPSGKGGEVSVLPSSRYANLWIWERMSCSVFPSGRYAVCNTFVSYLFSGVNILYHVQGRIL